MTTADLNKLESDLFTNIDPESLPAELKGSYKNMLADYTRKTQALSERRKEFDQKETGFQDKLKTLGALEQEVGQWRNWWQSVEQEKELGEGNEILPDPTNPNIGLTDDAKITASMIALKKEVDGLKDELKSAHTAIRDSHAQVNKMFNYQAQLNELVSKHPKVDKAKLLEFAVGKGLNDLEDAYNRLHHDDIIEEKVQERLREELGKARTDGIHSSGHQMIMRAKEGSPKSFTEATEQIVQQKAREGTLE